MGESLWGWGAGTDGGGLFGRGAVPKTRRLYGGAAAACPSQPARVPFPRLRCPGPRPEPGTGLGAAGHAREGPRVSSGRGLALGGGEAAAAPACIYQPGGQNFAPSPAMEPPVPAAAVLPAPLRGSCLRRLRGLLPVGAWQESQELVRIGGPVFLAQLLVFLISVVSSIFCGHLGKAELDAVTLAVSVINVTGISVGSGLASACDTLMSQTYGSKNTKRVGTILQRGILILLLCCFPCWALFINTERILLLLRQDPEVSRLTQIYVMIFIPALPAAFLNQLQTRYLQSQAIILPQVVTGVAANLLNVAMNALFLYVLRLGLVGSAWANTISQYTQTVLLFLFVWWKKIHVKTWEGWTRDCLQEWGSFFRLAMLGMFMTCIEWWTFEIGSFLTGLIGVVELGAQSVIYELFTAAYMVPLGFSVAASVKVGNALGAGDAAQAKKSSITALLCAGAFGMVVSVTLGSLKDVVGYIFTSDIEIVTLVSKVMLIFAPFHLLDAVGATCGGVLRGTGNQKIGAIANAIGYYVIGFPIGISLMFAAKLGLIGLWVGMAVCMSFQAFSFLIFVLRMDWKKAAEEAQIRAGVKQQPVVVFASGAVADETGGSVETEVQDAVVLPDPISRSESQPDRQLVLQEDSSLVSSSPGQHILSGKELIFRRGLALAVAIAVLLVGVLVRFLTGNG
ncbi:multidrug and toxin extrusion protein 1 isoform X3 [Carettochelys insculpta]|uniref:multidrug and toxin extrusion protein 1 isoform X3 n=1 Tax=Carettochelys insculpta TaxID=44489 RepID=UPI003EC1237E